MHKHGLLVHLVKAVLWRTLKIQQSIISLHHIVNSGLITALSMQYSIKPPLVGPQICNCRASLRYTGRLAVVPHRVPNHEDYGIDLWFSFLEPNSVVELGDTCLPPSTSAQFVSVTSFAISCVLKQQQCVVIAAHPLVSKMFGSLPLLGCQHQSSESALQSIHFLPLWPKETKGCRICSIRSLFMPL
jgi:hypothetical protein